MKLRLDVQSFQVRLFGYLLLAGGIPFLLMIIFTLVQSSRLENAEAAHLVKTTVRLSGLRVDEIVRETDFLYRDILQSKAVQYHDASRATDAAEMESALSDWKQRSSYITGIHLAMADGAQFSSQLNQVPPVPSSLDTPLQWNEARWVIREAITRTSADQVIPKTDKYMSRIGALYNLRNSSPLGTVWIDVDMDRICRDSLGSLAYPGSIIGLRTQDAFWVCTNDSSKDQKWLDSIIRRAESMKTNLVGGFAVGSAQTPSGGWQIYTVVDTESMPAGETWRVFLSILTIIALLFAVFVSIAASRRIVRPISNLIQLMQRAGQGDLKAYSHIYGSREIQELGSSYNQMINQLENLIRRVKTEERLKKEAEIQALQYQLNPHFLYNTLNTIKWVAKLNKTPQISDIVSALVRLLQASLGKKGEFIPLREEMKLIGDYLNIQAFRFGDTVDVNYELEENVLNCLVPRMLLQPLVENALFHGLEPSQHPRKLWVRSRIREDRLICEVEDNGVGMNPEGREMQNKNRFSGIGLRHVHEKIQLYYGPEFGLEITSTFGTGTRVTVTLPIQSEER